MNAQVYTLDSTGAFRKTNYELHANVYPVVFISIMSNIMCIPSQKLKQCYTYMQNYFAFHCRITLIKGVNRIINIFYSFRGILIKRHILLFCYTVYLSIRVMCRRAHVVCAFTLGCSIFGIPMCQFQFSLRDFRLPPRMLMRSALF